MVRTSLLAFASLALAVACGGSSFVAEDEGGTAGNGGSNGGSSPSGGTGNGGRGGSTGSGGSGTGGASTGGTSTGGANSGGTGTGGTGTGGSGAGGSGASGGSTGGNGFGGDAGGGGSGAGGSSGGAGGSTGGIGTGGLAGGGTGGDAGSAGCGICPFIACAPPLWLTVVASDEGGMIQDLTLDAPEELGIQCFAGGGVPCQWSCQSFVFNPPAGQYQLTISAPGYASKSISFEVMEPENCGCCGCGCQNFYQGEISLEASGNTGGTCCADTRTDPANCGSCGNACLDTPCTDGSCGR